MGVKYGMNVRDILIHGCQICGYGATDPPFFPGSTLLIDRATQSIEPKFGLRIIISIVFQKVTIINWSHFSRQTHLLPLLSPFPSFER